MGRGRVLRGGGPAARARCRAVVGYLDARHHGPAGIARAVIDKLALTGGGAGGAGIAPHGSGGEAELLADRPAGWQCLLFAGVLRQGFADLRAKYQDYAFGYPPPDGARYADDAEVLRYVADRMMLLEAIRCRFDRVFSLSAQEAAFESGDADSIRRLGRQVVDVYREFLDWAADIRLVRTVDPHLRRYVDLTARFADSAIRELRGFVATYRTMAQAQAGGAAAPTPITVTLAVDDDLRRQHAAVLADYCSCIGISEE